jgi:predicted DNA-binding protein (MmcQ/YjbR family)
MGDNIVVLEDARMQQHSRERVKIGIGVKKGSLAAMLEKRRGEINSACYFPKKFWINVSLGGGSCFQGLLYSYLCLRDCDVEV